MSDIDQEYNKIKKQFRRAVCWRQAAMISQSLMPRAIPMGITAGSIVGVSELFNIWQHISQQAQPLVAAGFVMAIGASAFINKAGSPLVGRKEAIKAINADFEGDAQPAKELDDKASDSTDPIRRGMMRLHKTQLWTEYGGQIKNQKLNFGFRDYWRNNGRQALNLTKVSFAFAFFSSAAGVDLPAPPPAPPPPLPPLEFQTWVNPPPGVIQAQAYTDSVLQRLEVAEDPVQVHEGSIMSIRVDNTEAVVSMNGNTLEPLPPESGHSNLAQSYHMYEIPLNEGDITVSITYNDEILDWAFNVTPDENPTVQVHGHGIAEDGRAYIEYSVEDDFGVRRVEAGDPLRNNAEGQEQRDMPNAPLPAAELPVIVLPAGP